MVETNRKVDKSFEYYRIIEDIAARLNGDFEKILKSVILEYPNIEAIYVLDSNGLMVTNTVLRPGVKIESPAKKGDNLSHKPYFKVCPDLKTDTFLTYSYVSSATGSICRTGTKRIKMKNMVYFLCIDFVDT